MNISKISKIRFLTVFFILALALPCLACAGSDALRARVVALFETWSSDPVATLYASPDPSSEAVAHLFENAWVDVLEDDGGPFVCVRCGAQEGYLLRLSLVFGAAAGKPESTDSTPARVTPSLPRTQTPLRAAPDENAQVIAQLRMDESVTVQSPLGDWACVTFDGQTGYVPVAAVRKIDNEAFRVFTPASPDTRVRLYANPDDPDSLLGEYYGYQYVYHQFEPAALHGRYTRVRIGRVSGYVNASDAAGGYFFGVPFEPPMTVTPSDVTLYADLALAEPLETIPAGTTVQLLGVCDAQGAYHIRWGAMDAYVRQSDLPDAPQSAQPSPYNDLCQTRCDTPFYDASCSLSRTLPSGTRLYRMDVGYQINGREVGWVCLPDTNELGYVDINDVQLVTPGQEQPDRDPLLMGYHRQYACSGAVLRDAPSDDAAILFTFTDWDDEYDLLGGVLPNGYIHVRSVDDTAREGYILASSLDHPHW